ncbi:multiple organellar RNA editing factor 7, mitochondrial isoform X1 [Macadamia integrifolia]|uniref:multiple organellar RNA editing factor 7, mitochondrial isoform X1 n=2 Tax=Macadamia integrifolia TaxID=60698 RepID=UPI001C4EF047|nr:multiple organellar RNA editing factor 7, mitochondrial isoform X1 [Macadamia integrifolia]
MFNPFISMFRRCRLSILPPLFPSLRPPFSSPSSMAARYFSKDPEFDNSSLTQSTTGSSKATFPEGCDYEHWFVLMEPPKGYPLRDEIIDVYIQTLAMALGSSVEAAKESIYSVSTKYYYAFGCRVPEKLTCKIRSLPNVRWVLPDSYLNANENDYGGEPFVDGKAVPYEEKYHAVWLWDQNEVRHKNQKHFSNGRKKGK